MKILTNLAITIAAIIMTGCVGTRQYVPLPDQTKTLEDPAKARIYVMRPSRVGTAVSMSVSDDGKLIGSTGAGGFLCWERLPGDSIVSSSSEGVSQAPLSLKAGETYYIYQHLRMGVWIARCELEVINAQQGRNVLKKCHGPKMEAAPASALAR
jgi:hypothetical protein